MGLDIIMRISGKDWAFAAIVTVIITALGILYFKLTSVYTYFEKRKIAFIPGKFIFGSDVKATLLRRCVGLGLDEMYKKKRGEKLFGMFIGLKPMLVVRDPVLAYRILNMDFEYFHDRGFMIDEKEYPLDGHLFFLNGNKWKMLRILLTPIFTSGKLRYLYPEMDKCSEALMEYLERNPIHGDTDMKETFARLTSDVIATSAFGLEPESVINPDNEFRKMGKRVFAPSFWQSLVVFLLFAAPKLVARWKLNPIAKDIHAFYRSLFQQIFDFRRKSGEKRRDFIQLLLELKEKEVFEIDHTNDEGKEIEKERIEITDDVLAAQSFVFMLAGFETTSDCLNYTAFLISKNKRVQDKARDEIRSVLKKFNGEFTYESLKEMTYLDHCITESTRIYPPVPQLNRVVERDYTFPDGTEVEKGLSVVIPLYSIQRDPALYPEPEVYRPERFAEGQTAKGLYLPFGDGPRHCIGKRFALLVMKMTLAKLLHNYYLEESSLTRDPLEFQPLMQLMPAHPLYIKIVKINK